MHIAKRALTVTPSLTLGITAKAKKLKEEGRDVVSFGAGEPDFNTPVYIRDAAKYALDKGMTKYTPASGTLQLKKAIADKLLKDNGLKYDTSEIVVSNGAKHSLYNAIQAIVDPGDEVIIPKPYWLTYPELVTLSDGVVKYVDTKEENGFKLTADELKNAITPKTRAVIFNNPNNPTGAAYTEDEVKALAAVIEKTDIYVIADEIYEKLSYTYNMYSIAAYSEKLKAQTIIVNGVSKTYAMTGWRIGYVAAPKDVVKAIANMQSHTTSNPNTIAQYASAVAYESEEGDAFLTEMFSSFDRRRKLIMAELDKVKEVTYVKPDGAFYIMVNISKCFGKKSGDVLIDTAHGFATDILDKADVAVIPLESFGADDFIRLSYAISDEDIIKGVKRIGEYISSLK